MNVADIWAAITCFGILSDLQIIAVNEIDKDSVFSKFVS